MTELYPYSSQFAPVSGAHASCEGKRRAPVPRAASGERWHKGQRSPSPGEMSTV